MSVKFINDWRYLFNKDAMGGRFTAFTVVMASYLKTGMDDIDGLTFVLLGLGVSIKWRR